MNQNPREVMEEEFQELIKTLPKTTRLGSNAHLMINYQGFWCNERFLKSTIKCQRNFIARGTDVFITSLPKTGTTWLKSLLYSVVNRHNISITQTPLLNHNPHELVPGLETDIYAHGGGGGVVVNQLSDPRLLSTHLPYAVLPQSVWSSKSKILHISRNPFDMLVSQYYFTMSLKKKLSEEFKPIPFEEFFNEFCEGKCLFGPYFENVLEYWNASIEEPERVLFLKYEDLKTHPKLHLTRMAEFIGMPFSTKEENVIDDIIELCSFKKIKELEVNKSGASLNFIDNKTLFRKGEVGDWTNHFTPLMVEKMDKLIQEKLKGTTLTYTMVPTRETNQ